MMSALAGVEPGYRRAARRWSCGAEALRRPRAGPCGVSGSSRPGEPVVEEPRRDGREVDDRARRAVGDAASGRPTSRGCAARQPHTVLQASYASAAIGPVTPWRRSLGSPAGSRRRESRLDHIGAVAVADGDLRAAATDVDDQGARVVRRFTRLSTTEVDEARLLLARDDVDVEPGVSLMRCDEVRRGFAPRASPQSRRSTNRVAPCARARSTNRCGRRRSARSIAAGCSRLARRRTRLRRGGRTPSAC